MKKTFKEYYKDYPRAAAEFSQWANNEFQVTEPVFDDSISTHRFMILCRFLGESVDIPRYMMDEAIENNMNQMLQRYEDAMAKQPSDPLEDLQELSFKDRNDKLEETFKRQTNPGLRDCLIPLVNFTLPSLFDSLIPYEPQKSAYGPVSSSGEQYFTHSGIRVKVSPEEEQLWIDNIQWSWNVKKGIIEIPF